MGTKFCGLPPSLHKSGKAIQCLVRVSADEARSSLSPLQRQLCCVNSVTFQQKEQWNLLIKTD
ncbi:hypothetical protein I79_000651 [Cricetulus griseus]|uniref:Uncharacterized protein n=1 Tax=Cricetulus griseus TaxID=10029 RepID=G3GSN4_CRIGR|nr:hypothetical protein I79_000651 [Cricetulus griseus]